MIFRRGKIIQSHCLYQNATPPDLQTYKYDFYFAVHSIFCKKYIANFFLSKWEQAHFEKDYPSYDGQDYLETRKIKA